MLYNTKGEFKRYLKQTNFSGSPVLINENYLNSIYI